MNATGPQSAPPRSGIAFTLLGFAALLLLIGAILWSSLHACQMRWIGGSLGVCLEAAAASPAPEDKAELARIDAEAIELERQLGEARQKVAKAEACPAAPSPRAQLDRPPAPIEDVLKNREVSRLIGCWDLDSNYNIHAVKTSQRNSVKSWTICFDESGNGQQNLEYVNGEQCQSTVKAEFKSEKLLIDDLQDLQCTRSRIFRRITTCQSERGGKVKCNQTQPGYQTWESVELKRKNT